MPDYRAGIRAAMFTAFPADQINNNFGAGLAMFVWNADDLNPEQEAAIAEEPERLPRRLPRQRQDARAHL